MGANTLELKISADDVDFIALLENLLIDEGFAVYKNDEIQINNMGIDPTVLTIVIPAVTAAITGLTAVLKLVAKNQEIEYTIEDKKSKRTFSYKSQSGKNLSDKELNEVLEKIFINDEEE